MLAPNELLLTLPSCLSSWWATVHPLNHATMYWARVDTTELHCSLLNYALPSELSGTLFELPPFIQFFRMLECRTVRHPVIAHWNEKKCWYQKQSGTGIRRPSPVLECTGIILRWRMPDCWCMRPRIIWRCPAKLKCQKTKHVLNIEVFKTLMFSFYKMHP